MSPGQLSHCLRRRHAFGCIYVMYIYIYVDANFAGNVEASHVVWNPLEMCSASTHFQVYY